MKRSPVQSLVALALAGLWALLPLAGALHDEDHAHRYCAEHGVVEEAGKGAAAAADVDGTGVSDADDGEPDVGHVACAFEFLHRVEDGFEPVAGHAPTASLGVTASAGLLGADGVPALPVLARAPKASPPGC